MRQKMTRKKNIYKRFFRLFYFFREGDECRVPDAIQVDWRAAGGTITVIHNTVASSCCKLLSKNDPGGRGTPLYGLYRYVRPQRVWFFSRFGHT